MNEKNVDLKVAVVGGTGQVGYPLSKELIKLGVEVVVVSRRRSENNSKKLDTLKELGAELEFCGEYDNVESLTKIFQGIDTVVVTTQVNEDFVKNIESKIVEAAYNAGVKRFVPCEFGVNTLALDYGNGILFDAKKQLQEKIFKTGMNWTMIFPGGIFDYFLPNLRFFEKITTFGNMSVSFPTHDINDIGKIAARAIIDERTINKAVQIYGNVVTQEELIEILQDKWPQHEFEYEHISTEKIIYEKDHAHPKKISAKAGAESDQERYGINYTIYVLGKMADNKHPDIVLSTELYPDYNHKKPEEALADPLFVFGE